MEDIQPGELASFSGPLPVVIVALFQLSELEYPSPAGTLHPKAYAAGSGDAESPFAETGVSVLAGHLMAFDSQSAANCLGLDCCWQKDCTNEATTALSLPTRLYPDRIHRLPISQHCP